MWTLIVLTLMVDPMLHVTIGSFLGFQIMSQCSEKGQCLQGDKEIRKIKETEEK
jgi:hypothetical protein